MSLKVKLVSAVCAVVMVLTLLLTGIWAASNVSIDFGGKMAFEASNVSADITGTWNNAKVNPVLSPLHFDGEIEPTEADIATWNQDIEFTDKGTTITLDINIENFSTERGIKVSVNDLGEDIVNLEKSATVGGVAYTPGEFVTIPAKPAEGTSIATFKLSFKIKAINISLSAGALYSYRVVMLDENYDGYVRVDANGKEDPTGQYILFGEYPKTIKSADVTIDESDVDARGYYLGSDNKRYAKFTANPYGANYTYSDGTTIVAGTENYFKVEPIKWKILDETDKNNVLIVATDIIDVQEYQKRISDTSATSKALDENNRVIIDEKGKEVFANNYMYSTIKTWLNNYFYNKAFYGVMQSLVQTTEVDNSASTSHPYLCDNTFDKIFLLSNQELANSSYGFSLVTQRYRMPTDYALSNQILIEKQNSAYMGNAWWWTRSPSNNEGGRSFFVSTNGAYHIAELVNKNEGVVPALNIKLA